MIEPAARVRRVSIFRAVTALINFIVAITGLAIAVVKIFQKLTPWASDFLAHHLHWSTNLGVWDALPKIGHALVIICFEGCLLAGYLLFTACCMSLAKRRNPFAYVTTGMRRRSFSK